MKPALRPQEAAALLQVHVNTIRQWCEGGVLAYGVTL